MDIISVDKIVINFNCLANLQQNNDTGKYRTILENVEFSFFSYLIPKREFNNSILLSFKTILLGHTSVNQRMSLQDTEMSHFSRCCHVLYITIFVILILYNFFCYIMMSHHNSCLFYLS